MLSLQATLASRPETPALEQSHHRVSRGRLAQSGLFFGLLGCWLLAHPYHGIQHDNVLYALQALKHLTPAAFQSDIFIQHGAQDQYTIFTPLYAAIIARLGLYQGTLLLLLLAHLGWSCAATGLFRNLLPSPWRWVALATLFISTGAYGSHGIFHFAESFVTPRLLSELCSLLALLFLVNNRLPTAGIALAMAALLHPIMALSTAWVAFVYLALHDRRCLWIGAIGAAAVVLMSLGGVEPFARLLRSMHPAWQEMVEWRNNYLYIAQYRLSDWSYLLHTSIVVLLSIMISTGTVQRLLLATLCAAWGGLLINLIGVDWLSNVFILQIQIWRTLWLLHVMYALAIAVLMRWCHRWREVQILTGLLLTTAWLTRYWEAAGIAFSCLLLLTVYAIQQQQLGTISRRVRWAALALFLLVAGTTGGLVAQYDTSQLPPHSAFKMSLFTLPITFLLAPLLVSWVGAHAICRRHIWQRLSNAGLIGLCSIGLLGWAQQSDWNRYIEQTTEPAAFFRNLTPPGATVLWVGNSKNVWLGMRRTAYLNPHQGAGFTFSADLAAIYQQRQHTIAALLRPLPVRREQPSANSYKPYPNKMWWLDDKRFPHAYTGVCQTSPNLDFIVAPVAVEGEFVGHWHSPVPLIDTLSLQAGHRVKLAYEDFYLYACARYRKQS